MIRGRDVSHYQGYPDWPALKAHDHLDFVFAKVSEGMSYYDPSWTWNRARVPAAGMKIGGYHYARPTATAAVRVGLKMPLLRRRVARSVSGIQASAVAQAQRFVGLAGSVDGYCLDLEASPLSQTQTNDWMRWFLDDLRQLVAGVMTVAYLGGYAANGSGRGAVDHADHWWYPRYPGLTSWPTSYDPRAVVQFAPTTGFPVPPAPSIWQCSDRIGGMDANVSNLTIDELFGGSMPTVDEIWAYKLTNAIDGHSTAAAGTFVEQTHKFATFAARDAAAALAILNGSNAAGLQAFATALAAALPSSPGGGPTAAEIATAVRQEFSTALGGTP